MEPKHKDSIRPDFFYSIVAGVLYGIVAQLSARLGLFNDVYVVMSFCYVFILPVCLGFIAVDRSTPQQKSSVTEWIMKPSLVVITCMMFSFIVGWEGSICIAMALPIYLPMAILGGVIAGLLHKHRHRTKLILLIPICAGPLEAHYVDLPQEVRSVYTSLELQATPHEVWPEIIRVRPITENQQGFFYKMGFPKPLEATLSFEGVGGVREAKFERGLTFYETITEWDDKRKIRFKIEAHPDTVPLTTLDPHVVPGGAFFDALEGTYEIKPHPKLSDRVTLHLSSQYRLSTHFNFYASWWGDWLMEDIQNNILNVIQQRVQQRVQ